MKDQHITKFMLNDYWNNQVCFCSIINLYLTLYWLIKWGDIGFLQNAIQELIIVVQAPSTMKPKYVKVILCQMYIFNTNAADLILW